MELPNGDTEWRMATSSTPGGSIPNFLSKITVLIGSSKVYEHVVRERKCGDVHKVKG